MAFYDSYEGVGVARQSDEVYATELVPVNTIETTHIKTPWAKQKPRPPGSTSEPITILRETKRSTTKFVITGTIETIGGVTAETKITNIETLYGFNANGATLTTLAIKDTAGNWKTYDGFVTRFTYPRSGGELFYTFILEFLVGTLDASA